MTTKRKFSTYDLVVVGVLAALIFVCTMFIKIGPIPTPVGATQIKVANALCLMGGMLFGGVRGGLAAGIGSMFFDLLNPAFVESAPYTLVFFFLMAFVCGVVSHLGGRAGKDWRYNLLGAIAGQVTYLILNFGKKILLLVLAGSTFGAAAACAVSFATSCINAVIAVILSVLLAPVLRSALVRAGFAEKLW
ncbi:ECF transporter S component [Clostridiaceae bacterium NSJ-31]|uniref:ECF transporter S component n=1 Tax=Ligaoa zhengdingensis TaxID=2763658 RepID=A0A926DY89_9FIRM|nr:ECF transporter S component [Ligaoa zhengdingensis]MBC8547643.1 ECF transporter S component [Ligaoa zhengdingensis]